MKQLSINKGKRDGVKVYLDGILQEIGTFYPNYNGHIGTHAFAYSTAWLENPNFFNLEPELQPWEGEQFTSTSMPMFGAFADATPNRWGRMLLDRLEAVSAGLEERTTRTLDDAAYLLAAEDATRMGALRFSRGDGLFLNENAFPIPTLKDLRTLAEMFFSIDSPRSEQHREYASRLSRLVSAGASLGGARPKVNYLEAHQLWIAKLPAMTDDYDVGVWEFLLNQLANKSGIHVPTAKLLRLGGPYSTYCVERFDRQETGRKMYASAMTWLQRQDGDAKVSYLDIANFITTNVPKEMVPSQLEQLFRRVVFNTLTGNRDDHLRNHGFLLGKRGWELSPAFDMNPNPTRNAHAIKLDESSAEPDIDAVMATAEGYQLTPGKATAVLDEVASVVSTWREVALKLRISRREVQIMGDGFVANKV